jgi:hypothetical protein
MRSPSAIRREPSQAWTQTQRISGLTSQCPSDRTPPHGPLRICFGQFIGQDMPVCDRMQAPHIRQSKSKPLTPRSTAAVGFSSRPWPSRRSNGAVVSMPRSNSR